MHAPGLSSMGSWLAMVMDTSAACGRGHACVHYSTGLKHAGTKARENSSPTCLPSSSCDEDISGCTRGSPSPSSTTRFISRLSPIKSRTDPVDIAKSAVYQAGQYVVGGGTGSITLKKESPRQKRFLRDQSTPIPHQRSLINTVSTLPARTRVRAHL